MLAGSILIFRIAAVVFVDLSLAGLEDAQVHRIDGVRKKERQVIFTQPIAQRTREKKRLIGS